MPAADSYNWVYEDRITVNSYRFVLAPARYFEAGLPATNLLDQASNLDYDDVVDLFYGPAQPAVAVGQVDDDWALIMDPHFRLFAIDTSVAPPVPQGRVISLYRSINFDTQFAWWDDGALQLSFGLSSVSWDRQGAQADEAVGLLAEVGFDLRDDEDDDALMAEVMKTNDDRLALVLAERLTGLRLTPDLIQSLRYTGAVLKLDV